MTKNNGITENKGLVELNTEVAIFEGGWWMKREDYDLVNSKQVFLDGILKYTENIRNKIGWDRNEKTHQLTYFWIPEQF